MKNLKKQNSILSEAKKKDEQYNELKIALKHTQDKVLMLQEDKKTV